jgi:teichuronic acid exporter
MPEAEALRQDGVTTGAVGKPDVGHIRKRAMAGVKAYGMRYAMSVGLRILSSLTLARLLFPEDFGPFVACSTIVGFGFYLCDVGITTYLVWQDHEPTKQELTTAFWLQLLLTALVVLGIVALTPYLLRWFNTEQKYGTMLIVMALSLFPPILKNVPKIALDRALMFPQVARAELVENVLQVAVTIALAAMKFGPWALVLGALAGRVANLIVTWTLSPFKPSLAFSPELAARMARNGLKFHINIVTPAALRSGGPLIMSRGLGPYGLGLVGWAGNQASFVGMLSAVLNQIALPTYSRLRSDPEQMGQASTAMALRVGMLLSSLVAPLVVIAPVLVGLVFGSRWLPAVLVFQWLLLEAVITTIVGLHQQTQAAAGRLRDAFIAAVVGNIGRLAILGIAVYSFGLPGAGPGIYGGALFEAAFLVWQLHRAVPGCGEVFRATFAPVLSLHLFAFAAAMAGPLVVPGSALGAAAVGLVLLAVLALAFDRTVGRQMITTELRGVLRMLKSSGQS